MKPITETAELADACERLARCDVVTVDTEFMRENTFWPKLCLVQLAGDDEAVLVDALAPDLDLAPLYALMDDPDTLKVFHAARQDVEIFVHRHGKVPQPLFDTQIAAMVCGFGDSVGYDTLVAKLTGQRIDKLSRFTDWANRPLSDKQLTYAAADVTHLRGVYAKLAERLARTGRAGWLDEEMAVLTDPATYRTDPREAWRRIKTQSDKPRFLAVLREVAAWRETEAQRRDLPRNRLLRDEAVIEIAASAPRTAQDLARIRGLSKGQAESRMGEALLKAVADGLAVPPEQAPRSTRREKAPKGVAPLVELFKVLLKACSEDHDVAAKLIANTADLEAIAMDDQADVPALHGWRREVFGTAALDLKHGRIALTAAPGRVRLVPTASES